MKKRFSFIPAVIAGLGLAVFMPQAPLLAQDNYHGGSLDTRQHGYEHGYRDGFEYGRDAKERGAALDVRGDAFRDADRGYRAFLGSRETYQEGYRDGYKSGAEDGYQGNRSRLEEIFGWRDRDFDPDRPGVDPTVQVYRERHWDAMEIAADIGYRDGLNTGVKDFRDHHSFRPDEHDAWKDANHGYDSALGSKEEYRRAYRAAYERGYKDGYAGRR